MLENFATKGMLQQRLMFVCAYCDHEEYKTGFFPEQWIARRYVEKDFYWSCPQCSSFLYPINYQAHEPVLPVEYNHFNVFSRCLNAPECARHEYYVPSCEHGVLTPRCLVFINIALSALHYRVARIEEHLLPKKIRKPKG